MRFDQKVYHLVAQIPPGRCCAYGDVAAALGSPRAARQVGFALARLALDQADIVPWHRVINARGRISGRGEVLRPDLQRCLLEAEGIRFDGAGRCDLDALRFMDFEPGF
jgi:methylated-DNA-protein-cysteine methyltransferase-like protein